MEPLLVVAGPLGDDLVPEVLLPLPLLVLELQRDLGGPQVLEEAGDRDLHAHLEPDARGQGGGAGGHVHDGQLRGALRQVSGVLDRLVVVESTYSRVRIPLAELLHRVQDPAAVLHRDGQHHHPRPLSLREALGHLQELAVVGLAVHGPEVHEVGGIDAADHRGVEVPQDFQRLVELVQHAEIQTLPHRHVVASQSSVSLPVVPKRLPEPFGYQRGFLIDSFDHSITDPLAHSLIHSRTHSRCYSKSRVVDHPSADRQNFRLVWPLGRTSITVNACVVLP